MSQNDLNALIGSRICHDLISPLGAINNGVELLTMTGVGATPEVALISDSIESANARIRFFRVAFGAASAGQQIGANEVRQILAGVYGKTRLDVEWQAEGDCLRGEAKLVFLLLQCLETSMPWGGRIIVRRKGEAWQLSGAADRLSIDGGLWAHLSGRGEAASLTSAHVHYGLAPEAARAAQRPLAVETGPNLISIGC